jgi:hypothetical protein
MDRRVLPSAGRSSGLHSETRRFLRSRANRHHPGILDVESGRFEPDCSEWNVRYRPSIGSRRQGRGDAAPESLRNSSIMVRADEDVIHRTLSVQALRDIAQTGRRNDGLASSIYRFLLRVPTGRRGLTWPGLIEG